MNFSTIVQQLQARLFFLLILYTFLVVLKIYINNVLSLNDCDHLKSPIAAVKPDVHAIYHCTHSINFHENYLDPHQLVK